MAQDQRVVVRGAVTDPQQVGSADPDGADPDQHGPLAERLRVGHLAVTQDAGGVEHDCLHDRFPQISMP